MAEQTVIVQGLSALSAAATVIGMGIFWVLLLILLELRRQRNG